MAPVPIPLAYRSSAGRYGQDGAARVMNMYAEEIGNEGKAKIALYAIGGLASFATLTGSGGVRAMLAISDDEMVAVAGRVLSRVDAGGGVAELGGVVSDGLVTLARNRANPVQTMITCDGSTSLLQSGSLTAFTDPDLAPANSVSSHGGYFLWTHDDGMITFAGPDAVAVDALDILTAGTSPDRLMRGYSRGSDWLAFGSRTIEAWNETVGESVFARTTTVNMGCLSAASIADIDTTVCFVAHDGTVRVLNGYTPERISTHEIERLISADASPSTISGYGWTERGHRFYGLTGTTWSVVYDLTTSAWHHRKSAGLPRWRCGSAVQLGTKRIFGHIASPNLYELDADLYTEAGDEIDCHVICPPLHGSRLPVANVVVDVITGVGTGTGATQNVNPKLLLDYSEDGAITYGAERQIELGRQGQTQRQIKAWRLGRISDVGRTWRIRTTASVVRCIMGARMNDDT